MHMVLVDVAYDLTVGVVGALIGALIIALAGRKKTRRLRGQIVVNERDLADVRLENNRLLETIRNRETEILQLQKKILNNRRKK